MSYVQKGRGAVSHAQRGMGVKVLTPISLEVSENGTTKAPAGFAYDTVIADVPNTYSEADNYKVIHNGELFVQAENVPITTNGPVDTKFIGSVIVTVPNAVSKETSVSGTFSAPVGEYTLAQIAAMSYAENATFEGRVTWSDLGVTNGYCYISKYSSAVFRVVVYVATRSVFRFAYIDYHSDTSAINVTYYDGTTYDYSQTLDPTPTVTFTWDIIHHPIPTT